MEIEEFLFRWGWRQSRLRWSRQLLTSSSLQREAFHEILQREGMHAVQRRGLSTGGMEMKIEVRSARRVPAVALSPRSG